MIQFPEVFYGCKFLFERRIPSSVIAWFGARRFDAAFREGARKLSAASVPMELAHTTLLHGTAERISGCLRMAMASKIGGDDEDFEQNRYRGGWHCAFFGCRVRR
jgi:hypothetical protein